MGYKDDEVLRGNPKFYCEKVTGGFTFGGDRIEKDPRAHIGVAMIGTDDHFYMAKVDDEQISYLIPFKPQIPRAVQLNYALSLVRFCDYCVVGFGPFTETMMGELLRGMDAGDPSGHIVGRWPTASRPAIVDQMAFWFSEDEIRRLGGFDPNEPLTNIIGRNRYYDPNQETPEMRNVQI